MNNITKTEAQVPWGPEQGRSQVTLKIHVFFSRKLENGKLPEFTSFSLLFTYADCP